MALESDRPRFMSQQYHPLGESLHLSVPQLRLYMGAWQHLLHRAVVSEKTYAKSLAHVVSGVSRKTGCVKSQRKSHCKKWAHMIGVLGKSKFYRQAGGPETQEELWLSPKAVGWQDPFFLGGGHPLFH